MMTIGLILTSFNLSDFYESPNTNSVTYLLVIIFLYLAFSFITVKAKRQDLNEALGNSTLYKRFLIISLAGFFVEFSIYGIPALSPLGRDGFAGLPVLHVIFYSSAIISVLFASLYSGVKQTACCLLVSFLVSSAILSRQLMMISFVVMLISIVIRHKLSKIQYIKITASILGIIFAFGVLGNIRQQISGDYIDNYIIKIGGANSAGASIGDSFYWIWLYIASPVYNLYLNFMDYDTYGYGCNMAISYGSCSGSLFSDVILPNTIAKYTGNTEFFIDLVKSHLNAGTAFSAPARIFGISGVIIQIILQIIFYYIGLLFTPKRVKLAFIVYFSSLSMFMIFDNLFIRGEFFIGFLLIFTSTLRFRRSVNEAAV
ncbi:hypothetical protein [Rahnella bruchi]|uniref:hypothetical protein n=1 Tax=Rahnella bruchi TaxID=1510573 RepID=UPI0013C417F4|nr:hypothetical protein [Rahnella bruchi]